MVTISSVVETRRIEELRQNELEEARAIQSVMLPEHALCTPLVTVAHAFEPVDIVGGDFVDYFQLSDESVGFYVGDVSGKGLPAAMYAALAVGILRGVHKTGQSPSAVISVLNARLMSRRGLRRHAAILYGVFHPQTSELQLASAGMPNPILISHHQCKPLTLSGIPPGLFPESQYETMTLQLQPGDSVLVCSDGVSEAQNAVLDDFGIARVLAVCETAADSQPADLLNEVFSAVRHFARDLHQHDDMAAVVFKLHTQPGECGCSGRCRSDS